MRFSRWQCLSVTALAVTWTAVVAGAAPREVLVVGSRVHVGDLVANASESAAAVEVGPAPAPGASRLVTRADIVSALSAKQVIVPPLLPDVVRVVRKVRHLASSEVDAIVRLAMVASPLGKGVTLSAVHVDHAVDVADGWSRVVMDVPRAPKRVGAFHTTAIASFFADSELLGRIVVPLDLSVSTEGAEYDVLRGSAVGGSGSPGCRRGSDNWICCVGRGHRRLASGGAAPVRPGSSDSPCEQGRGPRAGGRPMNPGARPIGSAWLSRRSWRVDLRTCSPSLRGSACTQRVGTPRRTPQLKPARGSLFSEATPGYLEDTRAVRVGDAVVIHINENANAQGDANTTLSRDNSASTGITAALGIVPALKRAYPDLDPTQLLAFASKAGFTGSGTTARNGQLTGDIAVRVVREMPNGDLFVEGTKVVLINSEEYHLYISGLVRPTDIAQDNSIASTRVADAQIEFTGRGDVADQNRKGWLSRLLDSINPL